MRRNRRYGLIAWSRRVYRYMSFQAVSSRVGCMASRSFSKSVVILKFLEERQIPSDGACNAQRIEFSAVCSCRWFSLDEPTGFTHVGSRMHATSLERTS